MQISVLNIRVNRHNSSDSNLIWLYPKSSSLSVYEDIVNM